jgi:hypothetical protein
VFYERREKDCQKSDVFCCIRRKHVKNGLYESLVWLDQSWDTHAYIHIQGHTANILYWKITKEVSLSDSVPFSSLQKQYDQFRLFVLIAHQAHRSVCRIGNESSCPTIELVFLIASYSTIDGIQ